MSGWSLSLNSSGNIVAAGSIYNDGEQCSDIGHVRIYQYNPWRWEKGPRIGKN